MVKNIIMTLTDNTNTSNIKEQKNESRRNPRNAYEADENEAILADATVISKIK